MSAPDTIWPIVRKTTFAVALVTALASTAFAGIRITCRDGATQGRVQKGARSVVDSSVCDIDRAPDGICTFSFSCHEACEVSQCRPDDCNIPFPVPCPPMHARVAVPVRPHGVAIVRQDGVMYRCLPARGATTTTTLPDPSDLTGVWLLADRMVSNTCPATIEARLASDTRVAILQTGSQVSICGPFPFAASSGLLTPSGFAIDFGDHFGISGDNVSLNLREQFSATLPFVGSTIDVVRHDTMTPAGPPPTGPVVCERTAKGVLVRLAIPCASHTDCLGLDPCSRCIATQCRTDPRCR
jgi:hypothetical protein